MWVRRHNSLEAALAAFSTGDVVLLLEGEHNLCYSAVSAAVGRQVADQPSRTMYRDGAPAADDGGPRALPDGVTILGIDPNNPQKVIIRHHGLAFRSADTATLAGLTLAWVGTNNVCGPSGTATPSSAPPNGSLGRVGLRVTSGRLKLLRCCLESEAVGGAVRDAAAAIWVGPGCGLDMATSMLSSTAEVGVKLAPGAAAAFLRSTLANKGTAVVCVEAAAPSAAGMSSHPPHLLSAEASSAPAATSPTSLVIGANCKVEIVSDDSGSGSGVVALQASGGYAGVADRSADGSCSSSGTTSSSAFLVLVVKRPRPHSRATAAAAAGGRRDAASPASGIAHDGVVLLMHPSSLAGAPEHVGRYACALCGGGGALPGGENAAAAAPLEASGGERLGALRIVNEDRCLGSGSLKWLAWGVSYTEGRELAADACARVRTGAYPLFKAVSDASEAQTAAAAAAAAVVATARASAAAVSEDRGEASRLTTGKAPVPVHVPAPAPVPAAQAAPAPKTACAAAGGHRLPPHLRSRTLSTPPPLPPPQLPMAPGATTAVSQRSAETPCAIAPEQPRRTQPPRRAAAATFPFADLPASASRPGATQVAALQRPASSALQAANAMAPGPATTQPMRAQPAAPHWLSQPPQQQMLPAPAPQAAPSALGRTAAAAHVPYAANGPTHIASGATAQAEFQHGAVGEAFGVAISVADTAAAAAAAESRTPAAAKRAFDQGPAAFVSPFTIAGPSAQPDAALTLAPMTCGNTTTSVEQLAAGSRGNAAFGGLSPAPFSPYGFRGGVRRRGYKHSSSQQLQQPSLLSTGQEAAIGQAPTSASAFAAGASAQQTQATPNPATSALPLQSLAGPPQHDLRGQQALMMSAGLHAASRTAQQVHMPVDCTPPRSTRQAGAAGGGGGGGIGGIGCRGGGAADGSPADSKDSTWSMLLQCLGSPAAPSAAQSASDGAAAVDGRQANGGSRAALDGRHAPPQPLAATQLPQLSARMDQQQQPLERQGQVQVQVEMRVQQQPMPLGGSRDDGPALQVPPGVWKLQGTARSPPPRTGPRVAASAAEVAARSSARIPTTDAPPALSAPVAALSPPLEAAEPVPVAPVQPQPKQPPPMPVHAPYQHSEDRAAANQSSASHARGSVSAFAAVSAAAPSEFEPTAGASTATAAAAAVVVPHEAAAHLLERSASQTAVFFARVPSTRLGSVGDDEGLGLDLAAALCAGAGVTAADDAAADDSVLMSYLAFQSGSSSGDEDFGWLHADVATLNGAPAAAAASGPAAPTQQRWQDLSDAGGASRAAAFQSPPWQQQQQQPALALPMQLHWQGQGQGQNLGTCAAMSAGAQAAWAEGLKVEAPLAPWWELQRRQQLQPQQHQHQHHLHHTSMLAVASPPNPATADWPHPGDSALGQPATAAVAAAALAAAAAASARAAANAAGLFAYGQRFHSELLLTSWAAHQNLGRYQSALRSHLSPSLATWGASHAAPVMVPVANHVPGWAPLSVHGDDDGGGAAAGRGAPVMGEVSELTQPVAQPAGVPGDAQAPSGAIAQSGSGATAAAEGDGPSVSPSGAQPSSAGHGSEAGGVSADSAGRLSDEAGQEPKPAQRPEQKQEKEKDKEERDKEKEKDKEKENPSEAHRVALRPSFPRTCRSALRRGHEAKPADSACREAAPASPRPDGTAAAAAAAAGTGGATAQPSVAPCDHADAAGARAAHSGVAANTAAAVVEKSRKTKPKANAKRKRTASANDSSDSDADVDGNGGGAVVARGGKAPRAGLDPSVAPMGGCAPATAKGPPAAKPPRGGATAKPAVGGRNRRHMRRKADKGFVSSEEEEEEVDEEEDEEEEQQPRARRAGGLARRQAAQPVVAAVTGSMSAAGKDSAAAALASAVASAEPAPGPAAASSSAARRRQAPGCGRRTAAKANHVDLHAAGDAVEGPADSKRLREDFKPLPQSGPPDAADEPPSRRRRLTSRAAGAAETAEANKDAGATVVPAAASAAGAAAAVPTRGGAAGSCVVGLHPPVAAPAAATATPPAWGDGTESAPRREAGTDGKRPARTRRPLQPLAQEPPLSPSSVTGKSLAAAPAAAGSCACAAAGGGAEVAVAEATAVAAACATPRRASCCPAAPLPPSSTARAAVAAEVSTHAATAPTSAPAVCGAVELQADAPQGAEQLGSMPRLSQRLSQRRPPPALPQWHPPPQQPHQPPQQPHLPPQQLQQSQQPQPQQLQQQQPQLQPQPRPQPQPQPPLEMMLPCATYPPPQMQTAGPGGLQFEPHLQLWRQQQQPQQLAAPPAGQDPLASAIAALRQQAGHLAAVEASAVQQMRALQALGSRVGVGGGI
ncbi:hypothetical protein PLESTB_000644300 [Pleodorina starrii]|uniref:Uncharacterized protein n=1 Tax=Pleodorina starrii TaxID=330485 RepID=A0A9W6BI88_9CHLO|nr:hypothetical protein PLESTM_001305600 [Pleodorina starrii]GLC52569.1 hypothetical protein PLESTB_000644300 [Pleodorina starrii]GLC71569.1 hypothetical protein PLESTF_001136500 [Pleodorina starrii]